MAKVDPNKPQEVTTLRVQDFSGGLNTAVSPSLLNDNEGQLANNVNFDQKGTVQPQKGRRKRYAADFNLFPVAGLGALYTKAGVANLVIASGTDVYTDQPHMDKLWDTQADWKATGTSLEGRATADRTAGSLTTEAGGPRANEVQTITITGAPTGGNFQLTFSGQTTANIPFNASALQVQTALVALSNVPDAPDAGVNVQGNAGGPWTVEFVKALGNADQPLMTVTHTLTGGTTPAITVVETVKGYNLDTTTVTTTDADWNAGTLTNLAVAGGAISLVKKGSDVVQTFTSKAEWKAGSLSGTTADDYSGSISLQPTAYKTTYAVDTQANFTSNQSASSNIDLTTAPGSMTLLRP